MQIIDKHAQYAHTSISIPTSLFNGALETFIQARVDIIAFITRKKSSSNLHPFDLEIEKTLNRIRKSKNMHIGPNSSSVSSIIEIGDI
ncbi:hypothetical protein CR513_11287, partial [Mucuna pruriens]